METKMKIPKISMIKQPEFVRFAGTIEERIPEGASVLYLPLILDKREDNLEEEDFHRIVRATGHHKKVTTAALGGGMGSPVEVNWKYQPTASDYDIAVSTHFCKCCGGRELGEYLSDFFDGSNIFMVGELYIIPPMNIRAHGEDRVITSNDAEFTLEGWDLVQGIQRGLYSDFKLNRGVEIDYDNLFIR